MDPLIPVNDLRRHTAVVRQPVEEVVRRVLDRGHYVLGPEVAAFEREFAAYLGAAHAVGVANGTDALELALRALGVKAGDAVATVANAGGYATAAVAAIGASPLYIDIEPDAMTMAAGALEESLARGPVAAVVVTHLYGRVADMPALLAVADRHGVPVVEDCAQAHGARLGGRAAGCWGRLGAFSFYPTKNLGCLGDGGAVATDDATLAETVRQLRQYGWAERYHLTRRAGRNSRLDEIQAAILRTLLPLLDGWNERRRSVARHYVEGLAGLGLGLPRPGPDHVCHLCVVRTPDRTRLRARLADLGIGTDVHYPTPDHLQPAALPAARPADLRVTEESSRAVLTLPCFPELTDAEASRVVNAVRRACG